ncbi:MAG: hypothetical protein HN731_19920 [Rhodospirillaceae bacterium]|jgi:hypothetical protein|nr:hypothetical protein [Rhodospirillaceae bacterium]MBT5940390.1 hypothetical protein [Rhodospirillaceae bacterium]MBT7957477.1 hypothetical protein [Rhodospirillaceae bacterium]
MKSIKLRFIAMGLTILPFVLAGWLFASWLAGSAFAAVERGELIIIDPPQILYKYTDRFGFKVVNAVALNSLDMKAVTLRVPKGHHPKSAAILLRNYVPGLIVDGSGFTKITK